MVYRGGESCPGAYNQRMRTNLLALTGLLGVLFLSGCQSHSETSTGASKGSIAWHETLDAGLKAAKAENKLVFVDFSAEW